MSYDVLSRSYLRRAEKLLSDGTPESLFYAAFELRCGIEAKMYQYLEAQKQVSAKKKKGWQINKLARNIERIFRTEDKVAKFAFRKKGRKKPLAVFYYTPVNSKLIKMGECLGSYLHTMKKFRGPDDPWWLKIRKFLDDVSAELRKANVGTLLGVPLMNPKAREAHLISEVPEGEDPQAFKNLLSPDASWRLRVDYLDDLPPSALKNT